MLLRIGVLVRAAELERLVNADREILRDPLGRRREPLTPAVAAASARNTGVVAYLKFDLKPDGRIEARYRFMGFLEGMVEPVFAADHFQLNDFTPFHDEVRVLAADMLIGRYVTQLPPAVSALLGPSSLGLFQSEANAQFGFFVPRNHP